ncbi:hypothetical protein ACFW04_012365 [Cataglyphis niger]
MPWPEYSEVFKFESKLSKEKNFAFSYKLCIDKKVIQASKNSIANLKKHINLISLLSLFYMYLNMKGSGNLDHNYCLKHVLEYS